MHRIVLLCSLAFPLSLAAEDKLWDVFSNPPQQARPMVWWHWMGCNISKEGITKDLESMKSAGIGGATIFNLTSSVQADEAPLKNTLWPENHYRGAAWWKLLKHAAQEADRLGLNLGMHNCVGYSATGGPWITPEKSMKVVVWTKVAVNGGALFEQKLSQPETKMNFYRDIGVVAVPSENDSPREKVLDLSASMNAVGDLKWDAPAGAWTVYRFGYTTTGADCHPGPEGVTALECDKLSAEYSKFHFEQVLNPLKEHLGPLLGKSFQHLTLDSYEAGNLNWTEGFREEFMRRQGYDPVLWLPTLDKRTIGNADLTERFTWDLKATVSSMFVENNFRQGKAMMNAMGVKMYLEPYAGPFNTTDAATVPDLTMGEFWLRGNGDIRQDIVGPSQAAGINVIGAEAFTAKPHVAKFSETPAQFKACGDGAWASGVNQLFLHHWVHQPFADNIKPGMGMGWWGTHFGRNQTWYEPGKAWMAYLGRSQALLQRGEPVSDYLAVDQVTQLGANRADMISSSDLVAGAKTEGGLIILPSGRKYAFLLLPNSTRMLPSTARKLKELVSAGAVIAGPRAISSPSLQNFPQADGEVAAIAGELWGEMGKGKVFGSAAEALAALRIGPDFSVKSGQQAPRFVHRRDAGTDIYFLSNVSEVPIAFTGFFRVRGKIPELWDAEQATLSAATNWSISDIHTEVELKLEANTSVFIVFRKATEENASAPLVEKLPAPPPLALDGPWHVDFGHGRMLKLPKLVSWTTSVENAVKYFSGTAIYSKEFEVSDFRSQMTLNLGEVKEMARVIINGKDCGVAWHAPFRVEVGQALKLGRNTAEIQVTNTWANRLIGDEFEIPDVNYTQQVISPNFMNKEGSLLPVGRMMVEFPEWLIKGTPRPSKRQTFSTWNYFTKDSPLMEAGLLGPVFLSGEN
ncbi:MAG: hypothetical protein H8M99_10995 [Gloeobacteraceae cyanobacterium ES-bin-144]|nr:hypothetical protein [Verrucomicrobiales bacterium]